MAAGCELSVAEIDDKGSVKQSTVPFNETFFTGYRRNVLTQNQVWHAGLIPKVDRKGLDNGTKKWS